MIIEDWEIFFIGARTLIGKLERTNSGPRISPVFEIARGPAQQGIQTIVFPVGWFPVQSLPLLTDAMSIPVRSLGPSEQRMLANAVEKADEMLGQMRAASSGIALAKAMPK